MSIEAIEEAGRPQPICVGCLRMPAKIGEYVTAARETQLSPDQYVRIYEGTYNPENGHFLCTACYLDADMPASKKGWMAP